MIFWYFLIFLKIFLKIFWWFFDDYLKNIFFAISSFRLAKNLINLVLCSQDVLWESSRVSDPYLPWTCFLHDVKNLNHSLCVFAWCLRLVTAWLAIYLSPQRLWGSRQLTTLEFFWELLSMEFLMCIGRGFPWTHRFWFAWPIKSLGSRVVLGRRSNHWRFARNAEWGRWRERWCACRVWTDWSGDGRHITTNYMTIYCSCRNYITQCPLISRRTNVHAGRASAPKSRFLLGSWAEWPRAEVAVQHFLSLFEISNPSSLFDEDLYILFTFLLKSLCSHGFLMAFLVSSLYFLITFLLKSLHFCTLITFDSHSWLLSTFTLSHACHTNCYLMT